MTMPSRPSTIIRSPERTSFMMPSTPETAGMPRLRDQDRGVAGAAADLGHDPGDRQVAQAHRLAGQDLVRDQDHRLVAARARARGPPRATAARLARQVRADPQDHVADVGHPLAEVVLLDPRERRRVALQARSASADSAVSCWFSIRSWTFARSAGSLTICRWLLKMSASAPPSSCATLSTIASSSAADAGHGAVEPLDLRRDQAPDRRASAARSSRRPTPPGGRRPPRHQD